MAVEETNELIDFKKRVIYGPRSTEYIRSLLMYVMVQGKDGAWFGVDEVRVSLVALLSSNVPSISGARQKERKNTSSIIFSGEKGGRTRSPS